MRVKTICFIRLNSKREEKGLMIETPTELYILDALGQRVFEKDLEDYKMDWNFVVNLDMGTF